MKSWKPLIVLIIVILISSSILNMFVLSQPAEEKNDSYSDLKCNDKSNSRINNSNIALDAYVLDKIPIKDPVSSLAHSNNSIYYITSYNQTMTVIAKFSLENNTTIDYIYLSDQINEIYITNGKLYGSYSPDGYSRTPVYVYSLPNFTRINHFLVYGYKPVILDSNIFTLRHTYFWRYERWYIAVSDLIDPHSPKNIVTEYQLDAEHHSDLVYDGYRMTVMTSNSLKFFDMEEQQVKDSLFLPGVIKEDTEYNFGGIMFDGRYYWLLELNTQNLFKVDVLSYFDQDEDGLSDAAEIEAGTSIYEEDTDNDGMDDYFEVSYDLDPLNPDDNVTDRDNDGLSNIEEYKLGSNPNKVDTDNDGLSDFQEAELGTNVNDADTDGDGLIDGKDPRPLVKLRWWEKIGIFWPVIIAGAFTLFILLRKHHMRNA